MIRLGVIGLSDGNGHPYSWSSICNGYNREAMADCPYPVIPKYLGEQRWPEAKLPDVEVTHIWTQDLELSQHVANAANIATIVDLPEAMLGQVDGVLLARDDAETHFHYARPFLEAGLPVFIDKPLAYNQATAKLLYDLETYPGQLYTCSSLRFDAGLQLSPKQQSIVGEVVRVEGSIPKSWQKYAIHVIEPSLALLNWPVESPSKVQINRTGPATHLEAVWSSGISLGLTTFGLPMGPLRLTVIGTLGVVELALESTFDAFKASIEGFLTSIKERRRPIPKEQTMACIALVEAGIS